MTYSWILGPVASYVIGKDGNVIAVPEPEEDHEGGGHAFDPDTGHSGDGRSLDTYFDYDEPTDFENWFDRNVLHESEDGALFDSVISACNDILHIPIMIRGFEFCLFDFLELSICISILALVIAWSRD